MTQATRERSVSRGQKNEKGRKTNHEQLNGVEKKNKIPIETKIKRQNHLTKHI